MYVPAPILGAGTFSPVDRSARLRSACLPPVVRATHTPVCLASSRSRSRWFAPLYAALRCFDFLLMPGSRRTAIAPGRNSPRKISARTRCGFIHPFVAPASLAELEPSSIPFRSSKPRWNGHALGTANVGSSELDLSSAVPRRLGYSGLDRLSS